MVVVVVVEVGAGGGGDTGRRGRRCRQFSLHRSGRKDLQDIGFGNDEIGGGRGGEGKGERVGDGCRGRQLRVDFRHCDEGGVVVEVMVVVMVVVVVVVVMVLVAIAVVV